MQKKKTALVLSAGGMFGAYQAGAWQVINETFEPDLVVGASVGALNGWLIAGGGTPQDLLESWMDPATAQVLTLRQKSGFRFDPVPLHEHANQLYKRFTPRVRFGLVVVKLKGLDQRLVEYPLVRPEHLQATASIPLCLPPVRIGGERYLDGGLFDKLPVWAAVEMGATRIIAIDCLLLRDGWMRTGITLFRRLKPRRELPGGLELTVVAPETPMGDWQDAVFWNRGNIERWIEQGAADAKRVLARE